MTPTQFAWSVVGRYPYPPPHPHPAPDDRCWLCGGPAGNDPWPRDVAFAPTFTTFSRAAIPHSDSVCQACVAMAKGETWNAYVAGRDLPYSSVYDTLAAIGVPRPEQRVGPLPYAEGWHLKRGWPDTYRRLVDRYGQKWGTP